MAVKSKTALHTDVATKLADNIPIVASQHRSVANDFVDSWEDVVFSGTRVQIDAIASPVLRQVVFNTTDNDYEFYDGTRFVKQAHPKYKVYVSYLEQAGTAAPTATDRENNLGALVWTRFGLGQYEATLAAAFTGQVDIFFSGGSGATIFQCQKIDNNVVRISAFGQNVGTQLFEGSDDILFGTVEVRVNW